MTSDTLLEWAATVTVTAEHERISDSVNGEH